MMMAGEGQRRSASRVLLLLLLIITALVAVSSADAQLAEEGTWFICNGDDGEAEGGEVTLRLLPDLPERATWFKHVVVPLPPRPPA